MRRINTLMLAGVLALAGCAGQVEAEKGPDVAPNAAEQEAIKYTLAAEQAAVDAERALAAYKSAFASRKRVAGHYSAAFKRFEARYQDALAGGVPEIIAIARKNRDTVCLDGLDAIVAEGQRCKVAREAAEDACRVRDSYLPPIAGAAGDPGP